MLIASSNLGSCETGGSIAPLSDFAIAPALKSSNRKIQKMREIFIILVTTCFSAGNSNVFNHVLNMLRWRLGQVAYRNGNSKVEQHADHANALR